MGDIKHDPDPLLTRMMNLMWRYDKDPSADALVNVLNEAAAEIERLRHELSGVWAVANLLASRLETISSGNVMVLQSYDKALQEARRG